MFVELQGKQLKKDWKDLIKKSQEIDPNNETVKEKETLTFEDDDTEIVTLEFNKADEEIFLAVTHKYGYFSFDIPLDDDLMFEIVDCLKSKADKIERLIDLNK